MFTLNDWNNYDRHEMKLVNAMCTLLQSSGCHVKAVSPLGLWECD